MNPSAAMMGCCAKLSNPDYSKILSISSASDTLTILILSQDLFKIDLLNIKVLSSAFQSAWSWLAHVEIVLTFISSFLFLCQYLFDDFFSYWYQLVHVTGVSTPFQHFGWDDQSRYFLVPIRYCCTFSTQNCRRWSLYLVSFANLLSYGFFF